MVIGGLQETGEDEPFGGFGPIDADTDST